MSCLVISQSSPFFSHFQFLHSFIHSFFLSFFQTLFRRPPLTPNSHCTHTEPQQNNKEKERNTKKERNKETLERDHNHWFLLFSWKAWRILGNETRPPSRIPRKFLMAAGSPRNPYTTTFTVVRRSSAPPPRRSRRASRTTARFSRASTPHAPPPFRCWIFRRLTTPVSSSASRAPPSTTPRYSEASTASISHSPSRTCFANLMMARTVSLKKEKKKLGMDAIALLMLPLFFFGDEVECMIPSSFVYLFF